MVVVGLGVVFGLGILLVLMVDVYFVNGLMLEVMMLEIVGLFIFLIIYYGVIVYVFSGVLGKVWY